MHSNECQVRSEAMSSIEWTDETWNPTLGCSRVSAGCDNCYAMHFAHRKMSSDWAGLTKLRPKDAARPGVDWTGEVRTLPARLAIPLHWRKPRRVFVDSMSDLFHPSVPFEFIAAVFGVMAATSRHTYQVLTKRPERAREFFYWLDPDPAAMLPRLLAICAGQPWPLSNVWLGTSVEDQATADARIPKLLRCPAALHFVSYEPALGPVDFVQSAVAKRLVGSPGRLRWIIVGGESGRGARRFDIGWARRTVAQCRAAGVPVFVKQLGSRTFDEDGFWLDLRDRKGGDMAEWPEDLRVREMPGAGGER